MGDKLRRPETIYKKLLELRRDKRACERLSGHVTGPAEAERNWDLDKIIPQIEILEWVLKTRKKK